MNWGLLYEQGRCKSIGIPWNEAEKHAVFVLKVPADYVRRGCLTVEDWKKEAEKQAASEAKTGKVAVSTLRKEQLQALCAKRGIQATDDAPRPVLIEALAAAGVPKSVPAEEVPN